MNRGQYDLKMILHHLEAASSHAEEIGAFDLRIDIDIVLVRARERSLGASGWLSAESATYVQAKSVADLGALGGVASPTPLDAAQDRDRRI
jgi:hypothetical protein